MPGADRWSLLLDGADHGDSHARLLGSACRGHDPRGERPLRVHRAPAVQITLSLLDRDDAGDGIHVAEDDDRAPAVRTDSADYIPHLVTFRLEPEARHGVEAHTGHVRLLPAEAGST